MKNKIKIMQNYQKNREEIHKIKSIKSDLVDLEDIEKQKDRKKIINNLSKIKKHIDKIEYVYKSENMEDQTNFPIKKKIIIKNKKRSKSFPAWLFNNNEL